MTALRSRWTDGRTDLVDEFADAVLCGGDRGPKSSSRSSRAAGRDWFSMKVQPPNLEQVDAWQRCHPVVEIPGGGPEAVWRGPPRLARSDRDHYGFFALAPLLVVVMTFATAVFDDPTLVTASSRRSVTCCRSSVPTVVGIGSDALTLAGGLYVQRIVANASSLYGSFATMVGLFAWIALLVQTVVYGTLVNVVRVEQLWPRSITRRDLGRGDQLAAELSAAVRADPRIVRC